MARRSGPGLVVLTFAVLAELGGGVVAVARHTDEPAPRRSARVQEPPDALPRAAPPSAAGTTPEGRRPAVPTLTPGLLRRPAAAPGPTGTAGTTTEAPAVEAAGEVVTLGPPFVDANRASHCSDGLYESCNARSDPEPSSGRVRLDVAVTSPGGGTGAGLGTAQAFSEVAAVHRLTHPVPGMVLTVTLRLRSADVRRSVAGVALPPVGTSGGQAHVTASALHSACGGSGCFVNATQPLLDLATGPQARAGEELVVRMRLVNPAGPLPPGDVAVSAGVYGWAELGSGATGTPLPDVGTVATLVDAVVTHVTFTPSA